MIRSVFITGASGGIGYKLAIEFAKDRKINYIIGIAARRVEQLQNLKKEIETYGRIAYIYELNVTDLEEVRACVKDFAEKAGKLDLVISNAGVGSGATPYLHKTEHIAMVADVNFRGVIHVSNEALKYMYQAKSGHIAVTGSVAAFRSLPGAAYSASKIAVKYLMDSYRLEHAGDGICFSTLCPGFIKTPMTEKNKHPMPFLISSEKAAKLMKKALDKKKELYVFPFAWRLIIPILKLIPAFVLAKLTTTKKIKAEK